MPTKQRESRVLALPQGVSLEPLDTDNVLDVKAIYETYEDLMFNDCYSIEKALPNKLADSDAMTVVVRFDDQVVGFYRFWDHSRTPKGIHSLQVDIAYIRKVWSENRILETSEYLKRYLFEDVGLYRIEAITLRHNRPAISLLERLGFKKEGDLRGATVIDGKPKTMCLYSIIRPEYFNRGR